GAALPLSYQPGESLSFYDDSAVGARRPADRAGYFPAVSTETLRGPRPRPRPNPAPGRPRHGEPLPVGSRSLGGPAERSTDLACPPLVRSKERRAGNISRPRDVPGSSAAVRRNWKRSRARTVAP